jgi:hypothetical protein
LIADLAIGHQQIQAHRPWPRSAVTPVLRIFDVDKVREFYAGFLGRPALPPPLVRFRRGKPASPKRNPIEIT